MTSPHPRLTDRWVVARRGGRNPVDPARAYAARWEEEIDAGGTLVPTAVVFLTNRECPFRCVMCDLWVNTLEETVPPGAIPQQIRSALAGLPPARQIKLYNAGSYFDPRAIPVEDDERVAELTSAFERVIVESHPAFLQGAHGRRALRFRDRLRARLEVAIGLETAHPETLARLNKRMTVDSFRRAAAFLAEHDVDLRVFLLLSPPFLPREAAFEWTCRSIDVAAASGATACTIIPTRGGNGAREALGDAFVPPRLPALEQAVEYGLAAHPRLRTFADLWDVDRLLDCECAPARAARLAAMNRTQRVPPPVSCSCDARH